MTDIVYTTKRAVHLLQNSLSSSIELQMQLPEGGQVIPCQEQHTPEFSLICFECPRRHA